jgi:uncharacterized protein (TIGR02231 family)
MKYHFLSLSFILLFVSIMVPVVKAQKSEQEPISKLQKVVVFPDKAMITKESVVTIKKGETVIRLTGITPYLVDQSVQISLSGQTDIAISEVTIEETFLKKTDQPEVQKLQLKLNNLNSQIKDGTALISVIISENEFLKKVVPFPQNQKVSTTEITSHIQFLEKALTANFERIGVTELKIKQLEEDKLAVENELAGLKSDKNKSKNIVIHLLSATDKTALKLGYSYLSTEAGWSSQYEARADFNSSKIDFDYTASIWQSTGEDWSDASMEISTAKPFVYGNIPDLSAWYLDVYTPRPFRSKSMNASADLNAPQVMMEREAVPAEDNLFKQTVVNEENTSFSFVLPRKVNIISDGQPHKVSISKSNTDAVYSWLTIPKLVQNAMLKATMKNPFSFPLLNGPINVYFDQKLVGTAYINEAVLPEGELKISMGIDEGIKIERKLLKKYTDYAGLLSKETTVFYEYAIEITNGKSKEVSIDLNDQFPISRNEKIKVEMETPKEKDATINEEGIITWKVKLAPGAKKTIPVKFSVSYPKDLNISGL